MAKADKNYESYVMGKISAYDLVKSQGLEALETDIKLRKIGKMPIHITGKQCDEFVDILSKSCRDMIFAVTYKVLNEEFGFGEKRLLHFVKSFDQIFDETFEVSPFGNKYISLVDYCTMIKEKFPNVPLDIDKVAAEEDLENKDREIAQRWTSGIISLLNTHGYVDAAQYLEERKNA